MAQLFTFLKSSDFARFAVYALSAAGVVIEPQYIEAIVAGGFALSATIHAIRGVFNAKK